MDFNKVFSILKNRLSDGHDVPYYFRDLIAAITDVPEEEWDTPKDPSTKLMNVNTLRTYAKRDKLPRKFAQSIVYRLEPDNMVESINARPESTRELLAEDFQVYEPNLTADTIANFVADALVSIIRESAGFVSKNEQEAEKIREMYADLKQKYGDYLYEECDGYCPFPGCGKRLSTSNNGRIARVYEVSMIEKSKGHEVSNLIAMCPMCHANYQMDNDRSKMKALNQVKNLLMAHGQSVQLLDSISLEKGIVGVIQKIASLKENELVAAEFNPKELSQKVRPEDNVVLYNNVKNNVTTYFVKLKEIMMNLDKSGKIDYDDVQDQMRAFYKRLKKAKKTQMEIFNEITEKIHRTSLQDSIYCQIVVCYFIQSCEVFDAIAE